MSTLQCPYVKSHKILEWRMQFHLIRCRRNHPNAPKVVCPFNVTHVLNEAELKFHLNVCPDRAKHDNYCCVDKAPTKPTTPPPKHKYESTENWDDEPAVPSYNPTEYAKKAPVLRSISGAKPSERKKFREEERARLRNRLD
uniref:CHHC U11-48K-type domain-containing protein n=1 Tax=Glossina palpalis gambiensis TaxID=67801 RepID=A0A1B0B787_9MUSC